jgi:uncharacterized protein
MSFREAQGTTVVITLSNLERYRPDLEYQFPSRMITLQVNSSFKAVGFMAVIATKLADKGISCNHFSSYYDYHLFVSVSAVDDAVAVLTKIAEDAKA